MRVRTMLSILAALLIATAAAGAQQPTAEIFGKATDQSGAVLPGVTVTLSAPSLLQPLTAVTSATGTYQFPRLDVGTYSTWRLLGQSRLEGSVLVRNADGPPAGIRGAVQDQGRVYTTDDRRRP
jgi:hypothetical protein